MEETMQKEKEGKKTFLFPAAIAVLIYTVFLFIYPNLLMIVKGGVSGYYENIHFIVWTYLIELICHIFLCAALFMRRKKQGKWLLRVALSAEAVCALFSSFFYGYEIWGERIEVNHYFGFRFSFVSLIAFFGYALLAFFAFADEWSKDTAKKTAAKENVRRVLDTFWFLPACLIFLAFLCNWLADCGLYGVWYEIASAGYKTSGEVSYSWLSFTEKGVRWFEIILGLIYVAGLMLVGLWVTKGKGDIGILPKGEKVACVPQASQAEEEAAAASPASEKSEAEIVEMVLKYKQLLDAGAITQEEFEKKKQQLLGL